MTFIIGFNGPAGAGKTTAATRMELCNPDIIALDITNPLKNSVHALFNLIHTSTDFFDQVKDTPHGLLNNQTPRDLYDLWGAYVSNTFGGTFLAEQCWKRFQAIQLGTTKNILIVANIGFQAELDYFIRQVSPGCLALVNIYHPQCTFEGGVRELVTGLDVNAVKSFTLVNNTTKAAFEMEVEHLFPRIMEHFDSFTA